MKLVIGNKNYSSWSMRPWILLRNFEIEFEEIRIPLFADGYREELAKYSPTLRVPVLLDDELTVWDSLSIMEYVNEKYLDGRALPEKIKIKALCRSFCAEMHSGFFALRNRMPMNCRQRRRVIIDDEMQREINRIDRLWSGARNNFAHDGDYLFGDFSLADCMYAPVVMRFRTYGVELSAESEQYQDTISANRAVSTWIEEAGREPEHLPDYEIGSLLNN